MEYIGIFDSGIGGLSVLEKLIEILPKENYLYYKDSKNCPYGNKTDQQLMEIVTDIVKYFQKKQTKLVVIACNTATTKCIKKLRNQFPDIIFVGTEPAIKVACDRNYKNVLVLATPVTVKSEQVSKLIKQNKKENQNIYLVPCEGLAKAIEDNNQTKIDKLLKKLLKDYKDKNVDSVVLGCTHYSFIKEEILRELPNVAIIDGSSGVARQVKNKLKEIGKLSQKGGTIEIKE